MSKLMYNGQEYSSGVNYGSVLPMSPSDSTKVDAAINSKADQSTTYTKTEVDSLLSGKASTNWINYYTASYGNPATIPLGTNYGSVMIIGCVQGIGGVAILLKITTGNITSTIDMYTGNTFSNTNLTIAYTNPNIVLTQNSTVSGNSIFIVMKVGF